MKQFSQAYGNPSINRALHFLFVSHPVFLYSTPKPLAFNYMADYT